MGVAGDLPLLRGDFDGARQQTERALALRERIGDEEGVALSRARLSLIMLMEGRTTEALRGLEEALRFWREVGTRTRSPRRCSMSPQRSWPAGAIEPGVRAYAAADAFLSARGVGLVGPFWELVERIIAPVRLAADDPRYSQERAAGEAMSLDEAAEYALSVARQYSERAQGE